MTELKSVHIDSIRAGDILVADTVVSGDGDGEGFYLTGKKTYVVQIDDRGLYIILTRGTLYLEDIVDKDGNILPMFKRR